MEQDKKIRQHITAAKGWLSQAEDSLAQENDIQGDLKLMLAQAELKRAQEKNDKKLCVRWFKRLAPGVLACCLALGAIIYVQPTHEAVLPPEANQAGSATLAEQALGSGQAAKNVSQPQETAVRMDEAAAPAEAASPAGYLAGEEIKPNNHIEPQQLEANVLEQPREDSVSQSAQPREVPAPDMQKLMQSAGSLLRE